MNKRTKMINKVAIAGDYRCGKDYLGAKFVNNLNFTRLAFADWVKEEAAKLYPDKINEIYAADKTKETRDLLGFVSKTLNNVNQQKSTKHVADKAAALEKVVITDLRFEEELKYCLANNYKIVFLGAPVPNYDLINIYSASHLRLPARPNISAAELINMLE